MEAVRREKEKCNRKIYIVLVCTNKGTCNKLHSISNRNGLIAKENAANNQNENSIENKTKRFAADGWKSLYVNHIEILCRMAE